jgi:16S rRNA (guanine527-N7)-methyltransferase
MATQREQFAIALSDFAPDFDVELGRDEIDRLADYYQLLLKWNQQLHLVAPCSPDEFAIRHVLESLMLLKRLPVAATVVDVGSGGGLPIIPCLLARPDLKATLVESSKRKAVFLREAVRAVTPENRAQVRATRFEEIEAPDAYALTCRALDRFADLLPRLVIWAKPDTRLMLFAGDELRVEIQSALQSTEIERIPHSQRRFLITGQLPGS